jgi:hypothetical protein
MIPLTSKRLDPYNLEALPFLKKDLWDLRTFFEVWKTLSKGKIRELLFIWINIEHIGK